MTVAACLIVKNEALVIGRCLASLQGLVQAVVIVDTGSSDDTMEVIRSLDFPVAIHLHERPWKNFAHNRTELLRLASGVADYLLLLDADQTVEGSLPQLASDAYRLRLRHGQLEWYNTLLVRSALPWHYEGATHEYLTCDRAQSISNIDSLLITEHSDGGRRPPGTQPRWEWDADVLESELVKDPTNTRHVFYLARTYDNLASTRPRDSRAAAWREKAIQRYRQRCQMKGYADEGYYSLYRLGVLHLNDNAGLQYLLQAWQHCPHRWEPVYEACRWLNQQGLHFPSYALSKHALSRPPRPSGLFIHREVYDHLLLFEHSISAYYMGQYQESYDDCQKLLTRPLPASLEQAVRRNLVFPEQRLREIGSPDALPRTDSSSMEVERRPSLSIPIVKLIHIVWVGDEAQRPDTFIQTWRNLNPGWKVRVWGNLDYESYPWVNKRQMDEMWHSQKELNGVADIMRWQILRDCGGFAVDADSVCIRSLEDWLFDAPMVVSYENESAAPGLLAAGCVYSESQHPLIKQIVEDIAALPSVAGSRAWQTVGPQRLTSAYNRNRSAYQVKILPSCHFIPTHHSGAKGHGDGPVFARQYWGATKSNYSALRNTLPDVSITVNGLQHNVFFVHRLSVVDNRHLDRFTFFLERVSGAKVLHVGFTDYPITSVPGNLHVKLAKICRELVGFDLNRAGAEQIREHLPPDQQRMYFDFDDIGTERFDWVIVPEVLEHVDNLKDFLEQIGSINAKRFAFSVPDAFALPHFYQKRSETEADEVVHPDHNCWFSPYTLQNVIAKYTLLHVQEVHRINMSVVAICTRDP